MDYQRACGIHPGRNLQGMSRGTWRTPYSGGQMQIPRMPEEDTNGTAGECCEHLAIVTSPVQCWQNIHTPCDALSAGTLFKDLYLPLVGCPGSTYRRM